MVVVVSEASEDSDERNGGLDFYAREGKECRILISLRVPDQRQCITTKFLIYSSLRKCMSHCGATAVVAQFVYNPGHLFLKVRIKCIMLIHLIFVLLEIPRTSQAFHLSNCQFLNLEVWRIAFSVGLLDPCSKQFRLSSCFFLYLLRVSLKLPFM